MALAAVLLFPVSAHADDKVSRFGPDFSSERTDRDLRNLDTFGHGTHLAGLIAGRDRITRFSGVAPGARLVSLKIAGADGETNLARVLAALEWVYRNHDAPGYNIRVVNLSLGVPGGDYRSDVLAYAVEKLWREGSVVVAAGGNSGTSQAAAVTSGVAARMLSARPELNPDQLKAVLTAGAVDLPRDPSSADGAGRIDLGKALGVPAPSREAARQRFPPAVLDLEKLRRELRGDDDDLGPAAQWEGRRWSGRRWSGRRWSGDSWIDRSDD